MKDTISKSDKDSNIIGSNHNVKIEIIGDIIFITPINKENLITRITKSIEYIFNPKKYNIPIRIILNENTTKVFLETIVNNSNSNIVKHAIKEFELAGYYDTKSDGDAIGQEMNLLMSKQIIELLSVFSSHGHSGFSAGFAINLFSKLANFEIISPLKLTDDEFFINLPNEPSQNKRKYSIFKDHKGIYNIDAFVITPKSTKYFGKNEIIKTSSGSFTGTVLESENNIATGRGFRRVYFTEKDIKAKRIPEKTISIPVTQIEVQKDDWLMFVDTKSTAYKELKSLYNIDYFESDIIKGKSILELTSSKY